MAKQLKLFPEQENEKLAAWDQLDPDAQKKFLQALARAIAQAIGQPCAQRKPENDHDR